MKKTLILSVLVCAAMSAEAAPAHYSKDSKDNAYYAHSATEYTELDYSKDCPGKSDVYLCASNEFNGDHADLTVNKVTIGANQTLHIEHSGWNNDTNHFNTVTLNTLVVNNNSALSVGADETLMPMQNLVVNGTVTGDYFITGLASTATITFGENGLIKTNGGDLGIGNKAITFGATVDLGDITTPINKTRVLIEGTDIYFRTDGTDAKGGFDYAHSTLTSLDGMQMTAATFTTNANADWVFADGTVIANADITSHVSGAAYRFVVTRDGISVQYATPEPATATLSLLALAALASRRKRH